VGTLADSERSSSNDGDDATAAGGAMLLREPVIEIEEGTVLAGRYQIRRMVGKGATGVVVEADDRVSRSLVAIKIFKPDIATDDRWQEIVGSELRHARKLQHPNVCRVFDAGEADGYRFLTMEFAGGGSLRQRLKAAPADRPIEERIADARAVVDGLAAIHEAGIIHRDVKPDNVLRMEDGRLVVTDFGLAVAPGQTTFYSGYSGAVGTPHYMAPEVAMGQDVTPASDVYSLGVILHEIFFGRRPELETTKRGRFFKSPITRKSTRIERSMAHLCGECLEELPPRRIKNAIEVKERFAKAVLGRYGRMVGKLRAGKWGIAAGAVLAVGAAVVSWAELRPRDMTIKAKVEGTAEDWRRTAKQLATKQGPFNCLMQLPQGRGVRVIWGQPLEAVDIDLNGKIVPSDLLPETYQPGSCPQLSPDGKSLLFVARKKYATVMVSSRPDGSNGQPVAPGSYAIWLSNGKEFAFAADGQRLALGTLAGTVDLFKEVQGAPGALRGIATSPEGNSVAALYYGAGPESLVATYDAPTLSLTRKVLIPAPVRTIVYNPKNALGLLIADGVTWTSAELADDGRVIRKGMFPGDMIPYQVQVASETVFGGFRRTAFLFSVDSTGAQHQVATGPNFRDLEVSREGQILVAETLPDGRDVISFHDHGERSALRPLTKGPADRFPVFHPDGRRFAYLDTVKHSFFMCSLTESHKCDEVGLENGAAVGAAFSPSGDLLAYKVGVGEMMRLRIMSVRDGRTRDLGPALFQCKMFWPSDDKILSSAPGAKDQWEETDLRTGRSKPYLTPAGTADDRGCPRPPGQPATPQARLGSTPTSTVWLLQRPAR
jgi:hypothetical protein